jgi:hypothetical protein
MPNGGSDCCGTCWFNEKNKGEAGYGHADDPEPNFCVIRQLKIEDPFYTYCANHPHRSPDKLETPVGPVYVGDSYGNREVWKQCPDTESVRLVLLELVSHISAQPTEEYPIGIYRDEVIIWQLGELKETRALRHLRRIADFDPRAKSAGPFGRTRASTVRAAVEAIRKIQDSQ